jgi:hypothetical protein
MAEMPDTWISVLNALIQARSPWQTPAQVASVLGRDLDETLDVLCDLDVAGLVSVWEPGSSLSPVPSVPIDLPESPVVTLSPLAACRLGVRVVEVGAQGNLRWARSGDCDPPQPRSRVAVQGDLSSVLGRVPDQSISPDLAAERSERVESLAQALAAGPPPTRGTDALPKPTVIVGLGLSPWPGPSQPEPVCPACGGKTLDTHMYCLRCDRWGLDGSTEPAKAGDPRVGSPERTNRPPVDRPSRVVGQLEAERLRARRKEKRQRKRRQQADASTQALRNSKGNPPNLSAEPPRRAEANPPAIDFSRPPRSAPNRATGVRTARATTYLG